MATRTRAEVLAQYREYTGRLKAVGSQHKELQPLTVRDVLYIRMALHPTKKQESKDLTRRLIEFLCAAEICTAEEIYAELGCSDKPVMHRLRKFKENGLLRKADRKHYIPTERMLELKEKYLDRVCD